MKLITDSAGRNYFIDTDKIEYAYHSIPRQVMEEQSFYITLGFGKFEISIEFYSLNDMIDAWNLIQKNLTPPVSST